MCSRRFVEFPDSLFSDCSEGVRPKSRSKDKKSVNAHGTRGHFLPRKKKKKKRRRKVKDYDWGPKAVKRGSKKKTSSPGNDPSLRGKESIENLDRLSSSPAASNLTSNNGTCFEEENGKDFNFSKITASRTFGSASRRSHRSASLNFSPGTKQRKTTNSVSADDREIGSADSDPSRKRRRGRWSERSSSSEESGTGTSARSIGSISSPKPNGTFLGPGPQAQSSDSLGFLCASTSQVAFAKPWIKELKSGESSFRFLSDASFSEMSGVARLSLSRGDALQSKLFYKYRDMTCQIDCDNSSSSSDAESLSSVTSFSSDDETTDDDSMSQFNQRQICDEVNSSPICGSISAKAAADGEKSFGLGAIKGGLSGDKTMKKQGKSFKNQLITKGKVVLISTNQANGSEDEAKSEISRTAVHATDERDSLPEMKNVSNDDGNEDGEEQLFEDSPGDSSTSSDDEVARSDSCLSDDDPSHSEPKHLAFEPIPVEAELVPGALPVDAKDKSEQTSTGDEKTCDLDLKEADNDDLMLEVF